MERVLIAGAGGFGRELLAWCKQAPDYGSRWVVAGFLDDTSPKLPGEMQVIGKIADYAPAGERILLGIGTPSGKRKVVETLRARGARFRGYIHPGAVLGDRVSLGEGTIVCPGAVLTSDVHVDEFVTINVCATVGHDARMGAFSTLSGHCDVTGHGEVGYGVFLGSHAVVTPKRTVGAGAVVGAGAIVFTHVPPGVTVVGNPARPLAGV